MKHVTHPLILLCLLCLSLTGCIHEYPEGEGNHPLSLSWTSKQPDDLNDIRLWIFDRDDLLIAERQFATLQEARSAVVLLPADSCTLVAATCPPSHYTCNALLGKTRLHELAIVTTVPGANPPHIQSGVARASAGDKQIDMHMTRILSELEFTLTHMPPEVVMVKAEVLNSADGFYPANGRLTGCTASVPLGEIAPDALGVVRFPLTRLMPVASGVRATSQLVPTRMHVTLVTDSGDEAPFEVVAPPLQSDEYYDPQAEYEQFKYGTVVVATIKDWKPGNDEGEEGDVH